MARHAARITLDRTELLVAARTITARRLKAHRVQIGPRGPKTSRFILDRLDQLGTKILAAILLFHPEELDEQHRGPDFAYNPADDLAAFAQRDGKTLVFLFPHLFGVVTDQPAEHRLLGLTNGALDGNGRHRSAQRHVHRGFGELR